MVKNLDDLKFFVLSSVVFRVLIVVVFSSVTVRVLIVVVFSSVAIRVVVVHVSRVLFLVLRILLEWVVVGGLVVLVFTNTVEFPPREEDKENSATAGTIPELQRVNSERFLTLTRYKVAEEMLFNTKLYKTSHSLVFPICQLNCKHDEFTLLASG